MGSKINKTRATDDLMQKLLNNDDIENFVKSQKCKPDMPKLNEYLIMFIQKKELKKAQIIREAGIDRVYGYEIFRGRKAPGRDTLIRLLIAMKISVNDVQHILKNTEYPILYPKNIRDAIIIYSINNGFGVDKLNVLLFDMGQKPLK